MHTLNKNFTRFIVSILFSLAAVRCGANIFSDSDDIKLGQQVDAEIRSKPNEYPLLVGRPDIKLFVQRVGSTVLSPPEVKKRGVYAYTY